jgi:hypothetical protein
MRGGRCKSGVQAIAERYSADIVRLKARSAISGWKSMTSWRSSTALCVASGACLIGTTAVEGNIRCDSRLIGVESQRSDGGSVSDLHLRFLFRAFRRTPLHQASRHDVQNRQFIDNGFILNRNPVLRHDHYSIAIF